MTKQLRRMQLAPKDRSRLLFLRRSRHSNSSIRRFRFHLPPFYGTAKESQHNGALRIFTVFQGRASQPASGRGGGGVRGGGFSVMNVPSNLYFMYIHCSLWVILSNRCASTQNNPLPWGNFCVPPMVDNLGILAGHCRAAPSRGSVAGRLWRYVARWDPGRHVTLCTCMVSAA